MNTKNLTTFKMILETGSFQKAADALNYTQSTVTFQMKQLENELNIVLFEKIGRKMVLTQAGRDILPYVDSLLRSAEQIINYGKDIAEIEGCIKLAIPDSILIYTMQPFLQAFLHEAPHVQLMVNSMPSGAINQALSDGLVDIGINCEKDKYPDVLIHEMLGTYTVHLIASPFFNEALFDFTTPHQRKNVSMICNESDGFYQVDMDRYFEEKDISLNPPMKVQSIEAVKRCVMNNLGIAVVPSYSIEKELKSGALISIENGLDGKIYNSVYIYHRNKWLSPQMTLALTLLRQMSGH